MLRLELRRPARAAGRARSEAPSTTPTAVRAAWPMRRARAGAPPAATSNGDAGEHATDSVNKTATLSNGLQQCQPPATIPPAPAVHAMTHKPKTVLIVDDDEGMRDTLTAILKREYRVLRVAERRSGAADSQPRRRRPGAARRPPARHQRLRSPAHRQGELQPGRGHHDLGDQRDRDRRAGDEARRLPLHHQGLRLRPAALARAQRERAAGPEPAGADAVGAGRRSDRARVHRRPEQDHARHRRPRAQDREAVGDRADPRRERHRQGAAGAADSPRGGRRRRAVHRRSTWPRFRASWPKARSSATSAARSPARTGSSSGSSSWRRTARCSSTKSATCGSTCRPSCCGRSRKARSSGSAAPSRSRPSSG